MSLPDTNTDVTSSRLDLNSMGKAVGVKAKHGKPIVQVLQSVLSKYGIQQDCDNLTARLVTINLN